MQAIDKWGTVEGLGGLVGRMPSLSGYLVPAGVNWAQGGCVLPEAVGTLVLSSRVDLLPIWDL